MSSFYRPKLTGNKISTEEVNQLFIELGKFETVTKNAIKENNCAFLSLIIILVIGKK